MKLTSKAFKNQGIIPSRYTCEGNNINPPLDISDVPPSAQSLVLLVDDPDVPKTLRSDGMYDHWVVYNMPATIRHLEEHKLPPGVQGVSTNGKNGYVGPCPPDREHRYFFKLYALDRMLDLPPGASKGQVESAMEGHIVAKCELMGRFEKGKGH